MLDQGVLQKPAQLLYLSSQQGSAFFHGTDGTGGMEATQLSLVQGLPSSLNHHPCKP